MSVCFVVCLLLFFPQNLSDLTIISYSKKYPAKNILQILRQKVVKAELIVIPTILVTQFQPNCLIHRLE